MTQRPRLTPVTGRRGMYWDVFACDGADVPPLQLQRVDSPDVGDGEPFFEDDEEAAGFVLWIAQSLPNGRWATVRHEAREAVREIVNSWED